MSTLLTAYCPLMLTQPDAFLTRMAELLGEEFAPFAHSLTQQPHHGLRANTLKLAPDELAARLPFALTPVGPFAPAGFRTTAVALGSHPYHDAGLYYVQEPSAMMVGAIVAPQPREWVLDLAAAPGGKATHLAALRGDSGLLVANDVDRGRAIPLAQNLKRWGVRNTLITNATLQRCKSAAFAPSA